jgi:hypothetical protein
VLDLVVDGERMALRYRWTGTHLEDFEIAPHWLFRATGQCVVISKAMSFLHWSNGRCVAEWGLQGDDLFSQLEAQRAGRSQT